MNKHQEKKKKGKWCEHHGKETTLPILRQHLRFFQPSGLHYSRHHFLLLFVFSLSTHQVCLQLPFCSPNIFYLTRFHDGPVFTIKLVLVLLRTQNICPQKLSLAVFWLLFYKVHTSKHYTSPKKPPNKMGLSNKKSLQ